ncbi:hypothetical protein ACFS5L_43000 [Streptomyces phyllanthi]|uniref:hypothetical protein n=1 Tax=Streptomyces phyllanthi TaxID=1803180 RepID=UPI002AD55487|nr:hypothetical protein [Streptomyces phyllanthi]
MIRRPVAVITAIVLFAEGGGLAWLNWFLGIVVDRQDMSLAGLDPHAMSVSSKAGGVVFGLYFALCGVAALLVALRDRPARGVWRILLISVAVVHGLLGAFVVGLVGWGAFAFMMVVLGLVLLTLMTYDRQVGPADAVSGGDGNGTGGGPEGGKDDGGSPVEDGPAPVTPPAPSTS